MQHTSLTVKDMETSELLQHACSTSGRYTHCLEHSCKSTVLFSVVVHILGSLTLQKDIQDQLIYLRLSQMNRCSILLLFCIAYHLLGRQFKYHRIFALFLASPFAYPSSIVFPSCWKRWNEN